MANWARNKGRQQKKLSGEEAEWKRVGGRRGERREHSYLV